MVAPDKRPMLSRGLLLHVLIFAASVGLTTGAALAAGAERWFVGLLTTISAIAALLIPERYLVWRWLMELIRAASLLLQQEREPKNFIKPRVGEAHLFPETRGVNSGDAPYLELSLVWDSKLARTVHITDVVGEIQIDTADMKLFLPNTIPSLEVKAFKEISYYDEHGTQRFFQVLLSGDALERVKVVRKNHPASLILTVTLRAKLNGTTTDFDRIVLRVWCA